MVIIIQDDIAQLDRLPERAATLIIVIHQDAPDFTFIAEVGQRALRALAPGGSLVVAPSLPDAASIL